MAKKLNGSSGTGKKILKNLSIFTYTLNDKTINEDRSIDYDFNVSFGNNKGTFKIKVYANGIIDQYSVLNMDNFARPLGIYNAPSLREVVNYIINNI